jgi:hypothetical protein
MNKFILEHPLQEFCKGDIDIFANKVNAIYSIRLSSLNPYYSFSDYSFDESNEADALEKTINILKYLKDRKADVLIELETGGLSTDLDGFILKFEQRDNKANKLMHSIYISFLATDNNNIMIEEMKQSILEKNDDVDCSVLLKEKNGRLIFDAIHVPNHHLVTKEFIKGGLQYITSFLKEKELEINSELKDNNIKVKFNIIEYDDLRIDVVTGIFSAEGDKYLEFTNEIRLQLENTFAKYLKNVLSIQKIQVKLTINGQKICITSKCFSIGVNHNKNLFNGSLEKCK